MRRLLGGDRSLLRTVLFFALSGATLALFNLVAFAFWLVYLAGVLLALLLQAPSYAAAWRAFVRNHVCSRFLAWLCRCEMRVRNLYVVKMRVELSSEAVLEPYVGRIMAYFVLWKALLVAVTAIGSCLCQLPMAGCALVATPVRVSGSEHDGDDHRDQHDADIVLEWTRRGDCPNVTGLCLLVVAFPVAVTLLAWIMTKASEFCIAPVFQSKLDARCRVDELLDDGYESRAQRRIAPLAPQGEAALGLTIVPQPTNDFCIPVPQTSAIKIVQDSSQIRANSKQPADRCTAPKKRTHQALTSPAGSNAPWLLSPPPSAPSATEFLQADTDDEDSEPSLSASCPEYLSSKWVLGSDRSFRRLVVYVFFSYMALALLHSFAFALWLFWIVLSFALQALFLPFAPSRTFLHDFLRENVCSGFLEWLCRWEMRVRNVYAVKMYIEPSGEVDIAPYVVRVMAYFIFWKATELFIAASLIYFMQLPFNTCMPSWAIDASGSGVSLDDYCHVKEWALVLTIGSLLFLRVEAWFMVQMCEICIAPVFRARMAIDSLVYNELAIEYASIAEHRLGPIAPNGESALGLTTVPHPLQTYCIPVPKREDLKAVDVEVPLLEAPTVKPVTKQKKKRWSALLPEFNRPGLRRRRGSDDLAPSSHALATVPNNDDTSLAPENISPERLLYVTPQLQAASHAYDSFQTSYQEAPVGPFRSIVVRNDEPRSDDGSSVPTYDVLSPTARQSQPFQLPRPSRSVSYQAPATDPVHFSAFCPPVVSAAPFTFSVWAFLVHQREEMREEATSDDTRQLSREVLMHVRRGALVHVTLSVADGFRLRDAATKGLCWAGDVTRVTFEVEATEAAADGQVLFTASIVLGAQVMLLRAYVFVSATAAKLDAGPAEVMAASLEMLPETYHEVPYDDLKLKELVGRGHFGDAYRATYKGQDVVVKTIRATEFGESQDQIVQEFRHEAAVLSLFGHHPHIVPFVGACTDVTRPLSLVTQYLPHGSLEERRKALTPEQKQQILKGAAAGFLNIHEGHFIHRDIAARNCLVDATFNAKVCDFGMCRRVRSTWGGSYFEAGSGPLKYMAPESLTPPHTFSYQSDVYSFGVMMWETFTEKAPFAGLSGPEAAARVLAGDRLALSASIPLKLQDLMTRCFRDDPSKRPTMADILAELD
ncbi:protein kinase [Achlya hypogyna]|uniref:Protein kinase n=1 Tax=Achlya hypogyna TaxID=1202772 RepID=A0A1V9Z6T6_ACHHY|nr:protein kinase [Achlya hypogyna]